MATVLFLSGDKFRCFRYNSEAAFKATIKKNAKFLFGDSIIYFDLKPKRESIPGSMIFPDATLIDATDSQKPDVYLVEMYLTKANSHEHILSNVTKLISMTKNAMGRKQLVDTVISQIQGKQSIERELSRLLGSEKALNLRKLIDTDLGILLIIDQFSSELDDITNTYTEWDNLVEVFVLQEYHSGDRMILSLTPDFYTAPEEIDNDNSAEDEIDDGTKSEDKVQSEPKPTPNPLADVCPYCGSSMVILCQAPFMEVCSNKKCVNSRSPFE